MCPQPNAAAAAVQCCSGAAFDCLPPGRHPPLPRAGSPTPTPPTSALALTDMGTRLKASGDAAGAQTYYEEAVRADPSLFAPRYNLGTLYLEAGDLLRAREHMEQAHMLDPQSADTMSNLGAIHQTQGNLEIAVQWYKAAVAINPMGPAVQNLSNALVTLGQQLRPQGHKLAIKKYQEALTHWHGNAMAYFNLGLTYASLNKNEKALINYQLAAHFNPRFAEAHNNMGVIHKQLGNVQRAIDCYHLALQCNPNFAQALNNAGMACTAIGRLQEALGYLTRCVAVAPNYSDAYNNLGWLFWDQGDLAQALHMYEKCVELAPSSDKPAQNRLLALNYLPDADAGLIYQAHALWAERHCRETGAAISEWSVARTAQRRLKIAYMSPDLFHHSVSFFAHALLEHRNRELFDLHIYSNGTREDEKTAIFKQLVGPDRWFSIVGKSASEAAEMIRNDQIDILIDLAGHTANNRLDVTAMKPTPIVMTYIGYNNTTGLGAVDYRITDAVVDPVDTRQQHSEELVRLPGCFLCYTPPTKIPDVGPLPAARNGTVTFGSFSCLAKVHPGVVALWSKVLRAVPGSKLVIKAKGFYSPEVQLRISSMFERHGIAANRLRLVSLTNGPFEHLNMYNEVDIALDTFPYANTTTTCETLLMGVPVVTLAGKTHGSRVGVTLLHQVGLDDLVAEDQDEFVRNATALANDLGRLAVIRAQLRPSLLGSAMCDGPGFMREKFEPMLLEKWRLLCEGRLPSVQTFTSEALPHPLAPGPFAAPMPIVPPGTSPLGGVQAPTLLLAAALPPAAAAATQAAAQALAAHSFVAQPPARPLPLGAPPATLPAAPAPGPASPARLLRQQPHAAAVSHPAQETRKAAKILLSGGHGCGIAAHDMVASRRGAGYQQYMNAQLY